MKLAWTLALLFAGALHADTVRTHGLEKQVEILRDRWGVPHIYASTVHDLFFAQGYITAKDRLFQIDLWRRVGTGKLAEVLGPSAVERDKLARAVNYRGDWNAEWTAYGPDTKDDRHRLRPGHQRLHQRLGRQVAGRVRRRGLRSRNLDAGGLPQPRARTHHDAQRQPRGHTRRRHPALRPRARHRVDATRTGRANGGAARGSTSRSSPAISCRPTGRPPGPCA